MFIVIMIVVFSSTFCLTNWTNIKNSSRFKAVRNLYIFVIVSGKWCL